MTEPRYSIDTELPERQVLVLVSLAGGAKHGYAIKKDVERFHGADLGPGTLYGSLIRLAEDGLIAELSPVGRTRPFAITALGRELLADRLREYEVIAKVGLRRL